MSAMIDAHNFLGNYKNRLLYLKGIDGLFIFKNALVFSFYFLFKKANFIITEFTNLSLCHQPTCDNFNVDNGTYCFFFSLDNI